MPEITNIKHENKLLQAKYRITSMFYDILDYPWERQYRKWRPALLKDVQGSAIEVGVGTGRNLRYYHPGVTVTGIDISREMLKIAAKRGRSAECEFHPVLEDAASMESIPADSFDWLVSTYLCCVMPDHLQPLAIDQFERVLKPGARFLLLEMVYSKNPAIRKKQERFAPFVQKVYGARFDRNTLTYVEKSSILNITNTYFLKEDVYLVIEGTCNK
ncbi:MAG: class I SAM-dependent methyltransferase [bacterium]|nr:class I SAM-dependent methyltransferase [bacterium]